MNVPVERHNTVAPKGHDSAGSRHCPAWGERWLLRGAAFLGLAVAALVGASVAAAADQTVWPMTPYQVQVLVAFEPQPSLTPRLHEALCKSLAARIDTVMGAAWNTTVSAPPPALERDMVRGLAGLRADQIPLPPPQVDKMMLVAVTAAPGGMKVTVRDFDLRTRVLNRPIFRSVWHVATLEEAVLHATLDAFAPVARVESFNKDNVVLRPRAVGLPIGDRRLAILRPGDVMQPMTRTNDRQGNFRHATVGPWSFFVVDKVAPEQVDARVYSGMRSALMAKGRGRIESLAIRVIPPGGATTLALKSRTEPKGPLGGYEIYSYPPGGNNKEPKLLGLTDQQGRLSITSDAAVLRVLLVKSGKDVLAKLPMVPGLERQASADLPNHDQRLEAEGFLFGLQEEMADAIARRNILMVLTRRRMEAGQLDEAAELMDKLNRLPKALEFSTRISQQEDRLNSSDKTIKKRIDKVMTDTREFMKRLNPEEVDALDRELRAARHEPDAEGSSQPKANGKG
ncbi:MAG: hypothetical protein ABFC96_14030 [Thermoguttaceae bacterium]